MIIVQINGQAIAKMIPKTVFNIACSELLGRASSIWQSSMTANIGVPKMKIGEGHD